MKKSDMERLKKIEPPAKQAVFVIIVSNVIILRLYADCK